MPKYVDLCCKASIDLEVLLKDAIDQMYVGGCENTQKNQEVGDEK